MWPSSFHSRLLQAVFALHSKNECRVYSGSYDGLDAKVHLEHTPVPCDLEAVFLTN